MPNQFSSTYKTKQLVVAGKSWTIDTVTYLTSVPVTRIRFCFLKWLTFSWRAILSLWPSSKLSVVGIGDIELGFETLFDSFWSLEWSSEVRLSKETPAVSSLKKGSTDVILEGCQGPRTPNLSSKLTILSGRGVNTFASSRFAYCFDLDMWV